MVKKTIHRARQLYCDHIPPWISDDWQYALCGEKVEEYYGLNPNKNYRMCLDNQLPDYVNPDDTVEITGTSGDIYDAKVTFDFGKVPVYAHFFRLLRQVGRRNGRIYPVYLWFEEV